MTMSKKIATVVVGVWTICTIASYTLAWYGIDTSSYFGYLTGTMGIVVSAYMVKSGIENSNGVYSSNIEKAQQTINNVADTVEKVVDAVTDNDDIG